MKKYVIVGAGTRGLHMYGYRLTSDEFRNQAKLAGVYDVNRIRADIFSKKCGGIPCFDSFDDMISATQPDVVIITTIDCFHHEYIVRALEAGCDAITEKPMTIDAEKCRKILDAERRTGKRVFVTFNMRFMPYMQHVKAFLQEGSLGDILNVEMEWKLDTIHGADYFRRWHRYLKNSGGLLLHKSSHHFDLINWWLEQEPEEVFAYASRKFYGPTRQNRGERCLTCSHKNNCEYYWDINNCKDEYFHRHFYLEAEKEDGYIRDSCVFADDIDIYDSMSLNVKYSKGTLFNYSLIAHSPYEGWNAVINGTGGRLEAGEIYSGQGADDSYNHMKFYDRKGAIHSYDFPKKSGSHSGGDDNLMRMLLDDEVNDPLGCKASSWDGAMSMMIGAAANVSISEVRPIRVKELLALHGQ